LCPSDLALAVSGGAHNVSSIYRNTMMQAAVPDAMRGRLQGIFIVVVAGGPRLGALYAGALASLTALWFPPLLGGLVVIVLITVLLRRLPRFRVYVAMAPMACARAVAEQASTSLLSSLLLACSLYM